MPDGFIFADLKQTPVPLKKINYQSRVNVSVSVFPWASIGLLRVCNDRECSFGSGFLFAKDIFVTAKHNFMSVTDFNSAGVWFGKDVGDTGSVPCAVYPPVYHRQFDLAVMLLQGCTLSSLTVNRDTVPENVMVCGFGDYIFSHSLSYSEGGVIGNTNGILKYQANTEHGDSGAPVIIKKADNSYSVAAVHTRAGEGNWNEGVLLSEAIITEIENMASQLRAHYAGE
ncbi:MAG: trypsin-like serine peptidase [Silvania sp.]